jgi:hypothetical protein
VQGGFRGAKTPRTRRRAAGRPALRNASARFAAARRRQPRWCPGWSRWLGGSVGSGGRSVGAPSFFWFGLAAREAVGSPWGGPALSAGPAGPLDFPWGGSRVSEVAADPPCEPGRRPTRFPWGGSASAKPQRTSLVGRAGWSTRFPWGGFRVSEAAADPPRRGGPSGPRPRPLDLRPGKPSPLRGCSTCRRGSRFAAAAWFPPVVRHQRQSSTRRRRLYNPS